MQPFATAFHFRVTFDFSSHEADMQFQAVSGLSVTYETETIREGGENRFAHQLPTRTSYTDVVLKRAIVTDSAVVDWCKEALQNFRISPTTVTIQLLDQEGNPLSTWVLDRAWPKKWELGSLDAMTNQLAIESLTLGYSRFHTL